MLQNRSCPSATVIPEILYPDIGQAIDWLTNVFGFTPRVRIGDHRAQMNVGDGAIVLVHPNLGEHILPGRSVMVRVESVDQHHANTVSKGARILREPADYAYGERQYTVQDFAGHRWTFTQSIADVDPESWGGTVGTL